MFVHYTHWQEARLSQEQLADQVAKASEDRQTLEKKLESAEKVSQRLSCRCPHCAETAEPPYKGHYMGPMVLSLIER